MHLKSQAPNFNSQIPNLSAEWQINHKFKTSMTKIPTFEIIKLGDWNLFVIYFLPFGFYLSNEPLSNPKPAATLAISHSAPETDRYVQNPSILLLVDADWA